MSWIDWIVDRIEALPGPPWLAYLIVLIVFAGLNNLVLWIDGLLPVGSLDPKAASDSVYIVYFIALYHYLNRTAGHALMRSKPILHLGVEEYERTRQALTSLPARVGWLAAFLGVSAALLDIQSRPLEFGIAPTSTVTLVFNYPYAFLSYSAGFALIIHAVRQLLRVTRIHGSIDGIDLYDLSPAYSFSTLTARTGAGLILLGVFVIIQGRELSVVIGVTYAAMATLAFAAFFLPLTGIQARISQEKKDRLRDTSQHIGLLAESMKAQVRSELSEDASRIHQAIESLVLERQIVQGISTWPWEPATIRGFVSATVLPVLIWLITRLLDRFV